MLTGSAAAQKAVCPLKPDPDDPICSPKALNEGLALEPLVVERSAPPPVVAPTAAPVVATPAPTAPPSPSPVSPAAAALTSPASVTVTAPSATPVLQNAPAPAPALVAVPATAAAVPSAAPASAPLLPVVTTTLGAGAPAALPATPAAVPTAVPAATVAAPATAPVLPTPTPALALPAPALTPAVLPAVLPTASVTPATEPTPPLAAPTLVNATPATDFFGADPNALPAPPPPSAAASAPGEDLVIREARRVALVIGNSNYPTAPLKNPVNDAQLMEQTLTHLGFEVMTRTDLSQRDMRQAISEFGAKIRHGGVGLFYYAGHGLQIDGENYLIPTDAQIENEGDVDTWGVNMETVLKHMGKADNHLNIVILDACRDNPFARSWRSSQKGLAELDAPTGTYVAYATAPGRTASDGDGNNGLYTQALSQAISTPGLRLEDVFMATRRAVERRSAGQQTPWENGSLMGVFYFNQAGMPQGAPPMVASAAPVVPQESAQSRELLELAVWSSVKNSTKPEDLELYLAKFPKGVFVEEAKKRVAYLGTPAAILDAVPVGGFVDLRKMPLLDTSTWYKFGDWLIARKPNTSRARVMTHGLDKLPVLQSAGATEEFHFYYTPSAKVALQLTLDDGDEALVYQTPKLPLNIRGCGMRSRGSKIAPREEVPHLKTLVADSALEFPDGYGVLVTTDAEAPESHSIRRSGDRLVIGMADIQVALKPDGPEIQVIEGDDGDDRCTLK